MKPTACVNLFKAILQFENINLSFPLHVLGFLMEDVITEYKDMDLRTLTINTTPETL